MKVIAYYRTSTTEQNLGIEAQQEIVAQFCKAQGATIIAEYTEHLSGKKNNRPELAKALAQGKKEGASLIVAKVDRLTRNASFGLYLCEHYSIVFCDHPKMGTLEQAIYFGMAQQEREYISQRTKQALQALKADGVKLGAPNATWSNEQRDKALQVRRTASTGNESNRKAYAFAKLVQGTYTDKARALNENGFTTAKGGTWRRNQVERLFNLMEQA